MYINRLHLRSFGKFTRKKLYLSNKFNIIFGENETGKSTIHNFIEAMLYGFDNEDEKYNKYKPWKNPLYKGTIELVEDEKKYLVSRDFLLNTMQVFEKINEENTLVENVNVPGEDFFKINKTSYRNTVSISQLGNKTEKELSTELKNKIINLSNTKDENVSIDRIMYRLHSIKEEAGNENNDKTLLGQYSLRLKELEETKENTLNSKRQVMFLAMEKKKLQSKIHEINISIKEKEKKITDYELSLEKQKFLKAVPLKKEIDKINNQLKSFEGGVESFSKEDYKEAAETESSLASMKNERQRMIDEKKECELMLNSNELDLANYIPDNFEIDKLNSDYKLYKKNNEKTNNLQKKIIKGKKNISTINIEEINNFIDDYKKTEDIIKKIEINKILMDNKNYESMKKYRKSQGLKSFSMGLLGTLFVLAGAASSYGGYYYNINYYYGGAAILPAIIFYVLSWRSKNRAQSAKKEIESMECEYADYRLSNNQLREEKEEIIKNKGFEDYDKMVEAFQKKNNEKTLYEEKAKLISYDENELKEIFEENEKKENNIAKILSILNLEISEKNIEAVNEAYLRKDLVKEEINKLKEKIEKINNELSKIDKEINYEEKRLAMLLNSSGVESVEEFKEAVETNEKHKELLNRREYCQNILDKVIGHIGYYELKNKTRNVPEEVREINKKDIQLSIFKLKEEKLKLIKNIDDIHKEIEDIEDNVRSLAEVEEEIDFYEEKIRTFKDKIKIAEITTKKINAIADSIRGDFMPLLRQSISDNFSYLTGGKYNRVIIDEDMNIAVMSEEEEDREIQLESLSGGTLDQLYLSLRISLSNILSGNQNIPLIFDDSFVQYDSIRLRKSIEMLYRESERRQIILFTCQDREAELAKEMNIKFKYIKL
ncbi:MAG: AAA family ATPase [Tissierellia bacterium]|nr:AAA family ATPase [Tissierellia bacterium]